MLETTTLCNCSLYFKVSNRIVTVMPPNVQNVSTIAETVEQIFSRERMTRQEYVQLTCALLSGKNVTDGDRRQINRLFDSVCAGRIQLVE